MGARARCLARWRAFNLMSPGLDVLRASYRNGSLKPELMTPGQIYELRLDKLLTSNVFKAGHKIRIQISGAFAPHFSRNLQTESPRLRLRKCKSATFAFTTTRDTLRRLRCYRSALEKSVVARAVDDRNGMRQQFRDGVQRFHRAFWTSWQIQYQRSVPNRSDSARQNRARSFSIPFRRISSANPGINRSATAIVASGVESRGPNPVPPVRQNQIHASRIGKLAQLFTNAGWVVGNDQAGFYFPAKFPASCYH